jgi:hypothetical protein
VNDQLVRDYIAKFEKRITPGHPYGQRPKLTQGLGHLLIILRQEGVIATLQQIPSPTEQWLARYDQHLKQVGGKAAANGIIRSVLGISAWRQFVPFSG